MRKSKQTTNYMNCVFIRSRCPFLKRIQNNSSITITIAWLLKHLILIWFHLANDQLNVLSGCDFHKTYSIFGGKFRYIQNVFSFNCMFGQFKSEKQKNRTEFNPINLIYLIEGLFNYLHESLDPPFIVWPYINMAKAWSDVNHWTVWLFIYLFIILYSMAKFQLNTFYKLKIKKCNWNIKLCIASSGGELRVKKGDEINLFISEYVS